MPTLQRPPPPPQKKHAESGRTPPIINQTNLKRTPTAAPPALRAKEELATEPKHFLRPFPSQRNLLEKSPNETPQSSERGTSQARNSRQKPRKLPVPGKPRKGISPRPFPPHRKLPPKKRRRGSCPSSKLLMPARFMRAVRIRALFSTSLPPELSESLGSADRWLRFGSG